MTLDELVADCERRGIYVKLQSLLDVHRQMAWHCELHTRKADHSVVLAPLARAGSGQTARLALINALAQWPYGDGYLPGRIEAAPVEDAGVFG